MRSECGPLGQTKADCRTWKGLGKACSLFPATRACSGARISKPQNYTLPDLLPYKAICSVFPLHASVLGALKNLGTLP